MPLYRLSRQVRVSCLITLISALLIAASPGPSLALNVQWTGAADDRWSVATNWNPNLAPGNGDFIEYDAGSTANLSNINDIAGLSLAQIIVHGTAPGPVTISGNPFTMSSSILCNPGAPDLTINNDLTLNFGPTIRGTDSNQITLSGNVVNSIGLNYDPLGAGGSLILSGSMSGAGLFTCRTGTCLIQAPQNYTGTTLITDTGTMRLSGAGSLPNNGLVSVLAGSTLDLNGVSDTIGSLQGVSTSRVVLGSATLTTGGNGASTTFQGVISGAGGIIKEGAGTFQLGGNNTYTGPTTINNGTLRLQALGNLSSSTSVTIAAGAVFDLVTILQTIESLSGEGSVNTLGSLLTITSALNPGTSTGVITIGDFDISTAALNVEINGANPGTGYDQVIATGAVNMGGNLNVISGFTPAAGTVFTIIDKTGVNPVGGTFSGLPEGATISAGGTNYRISYAGGDGNDVTLTALAPPPAPTPTPTPAPAPRPSPNIPSDGSGGPSPADSLNGPVISWPKVGGTNHYNVYRAACPACPKEQVGRVAGTSFTDGSALPGLVYYYFVRSDNGALSDFSNWMPAWRYEQNPGRAGDFNGDGIMDLLWWDPDTGLLSIWFMKDGAVQSVSPPFEGLDVSQWLLVNTGDFNGDGIWDLLWWNPETGEAAIWYMAAQSAAADGFSPGSATAGDITGNVTLSYAGDLDGDGRKDLMWRDYASGEVRVWLLGEDGAAFFNGPPTLAEGISDGGRPGVLDSLEWTLRGLYDMNADGKADAVWQHATDGRVVVWHMNGPEAASYAEYQRAEPDNWRVAGLGDLNGDGLGDIVWRNDASGQAQAWIMTGPSPETGPGYEERDKALSAEEPALWQVKAVGDFRIAGIYDVFFRNSDSGEARIVTLDGQEFTISAE